MLNRALLFFCLACTSVTAEYTLAAPYEPRFVAFDGSQWIQSDGFLLGAGAFETEYAYFISYSLNPGYAGETRYWLDSTPSSNGPVSLRFDNTGEGVFRLRDLHGGLQLSAGGTASNPVETEEGSGQFDPYPYPDFSKPNEIRWILLTGKWAGLNQPKRMHQMFTGVVGAPYTYNDPPISNASPGVPVGGFGDTGAQGTVFTSDLSGTLLNDPGKNFQTLGVEIGDMIYNHSTISPAAFSSAGVITAVGTSTLTHTPLTLGNETKSWTAGDLYSVARPAASMDPQHSHFWRTHEERRMDMVSSFNWKFGNLLGIRVNNFSGRVADLWIDNRERRPEDFVDLATGELKDPAEIKRRPLVHFGKETDWNNGSDGRTPGTAGNLGLSNDWNTTGTILVPGSPVDGTLQDPELTGICGSPWVCINPDSMSFLFGQISLGLDGAITDDRMILKPNAAYEIRIAEISGGNVDINLGGISAPTFAGASLVIPIITGNNPSPTFSISAIGNAPAVLHGPIIISVDSNNDGIFDEDAVALGLDPNDIDGDTDDDGISDAIEVGADINNPMDNDGDGIIDALETGATAGNAAIASGLQLPNGGTATITTSSTEVLSRVSAALADNGPSGIVFPFGTISYVTTAPVGGSVTVSISYSGNLPKTPVLYKIDDANVFTELPNTLWKTTNLNTLDITLTDGDPLTDLDGVVNGVIEDPVATGIGNTLPSGGGATTNGTPVTGASSGGSGGCTPGSSTAIDPLTSIILLILSSIWLYRKRYTCAAMITSSRPRQT